MEFPVTRNLYILFSGIIIGLSVNMTVLRSMGAGDDIIYKPTSNVLGFFIYVIFYLGYKINIIFMKKYIFENKILNSKYYEKLEEETEYSNSNYTRNNYTYTQKNYDKYASNKYNRYTNNAHNNHQNNESYSSNTKKPYDYKKRNLIYSNGTVYFKNCCTIYQKIF